MDRIDPISIMLELGALQLGMFTLKSGRESPYFFNIGEVNEGRGMVTLANLFAVSIRRLVVAKTDPKMQEPSIIFGPAYKGIPLAVATAMALAEDAPFHRWQNTIRWSSDRKEEKKHGEKAKFLGATPTADDVVVIVDDVITTGQTKIEALQKVTDTGATVAGVVVALDRMERGGDEKDAVQDFETATGVPVFSLATVKDLAALLEEQNPDSYKALQDYLMRFGSKRFFDLDSAT